MEFGTDIVSETIYLPKALAEELRALAKRERIPLNTMIVSLLNPKPEVIKLRHYVRELQDTLLLAQSVCGRGNMNCPGARKVKEALGNVVLPG